METKCQKINYAVIVSTRTIQDLDWSVVVNTLIENHNATKIIYNSSVLETQDKLRELYPRYACFVAQPDECGREYVTNIHILTRSLTDSPYPDLFWGILTGYTAESALRIAKHRTPLIIRKVVSGTDSISLETCEEGFAYSEGAKNKLIQKVKGGKPILTKCPDDTSVPLGELVANYGDLFVTSGHATERNWQIGYSYKNGYFVCHEGVLYAEDIQKKKHPIKSSNPKVYLPIGNCLMGHVDGKDAMALAFMNTGGVHQMMGYTVETWYGYAGWGCLTYFLDQPGRFTMTEAFFANQIALNHKLATYFPEYLEKKIGDWGQQVEIGERAKKAGLTEKDLRGLKFDRNFVAFYGDPAWEARMAEMNLSWKQKIEEKEEVYTFSIAFDPHLPQVAGGRPFIQYFEHRLMDIEILEGKELEPVITANFILVPRPEKIEPNQEFKVVFKAQLFQ